LFEVGVRSLRDLTGWIAGSERARYKSYLNGIMNSIESPTKRIRQKLQLTQTQFATAAGVSKGYMSEVETGIAPLSEKIKIFLQELFIDVEAVEEKHRDYMEFRRRQYRAEAIRSAQAGEEC